MTLSKKSFKNSVRLPILESKVCIFPRFRFFFLGCSIYSNQHDICIATFPNCNHRLTQRCVKFPKLNQATLSVRIIHINDREGEKKNSKTLKIIESNLKKRLFSKQQKLGLIQLPLTLWPVPLVEYTSTSQIVIIFLLPGIRMKTYWPTSGGSQ